MAKSNVHHCFHHAFAARQLASLRVPATTSALAWILALPSPAHAKDPLTQPDQTLSSSGVGTSSASELQEVVVTGIRNSLESAQSIKQNSEQIVDSVTAQDIGALPDRSVAEALQRIPGVMLERTDNNRDPARLAAEGGGIFIRGLSWVRSELNGRDIFSANDGRAIGFEDISADLLAGIDVYKNPTADLIEGGIGGTVNLRLRMPLDSRKRIIAFSGDYNYGDLLKKGFFSGNALFSDTWETGIGTVGTLVSGSLGNVGNRTDSIQLGNFVQQTLPVAEGGLPAGSTVNLPASMGWRRIDWQQERTALTGIFQWQSPNDKWQLTAQAFQARANPHDLEYAEGDYGNYLTAAPPGPVAAYTGFSGPANAVTSGTVPITPQLDTRFEQQHHTTRDFSLNLKWTPTDRLTLKGDVQYVQSHADITSLTAFTQVGDSNGNAIANTLLDFDIGGDNPTMVLRQSPNVLNNPANYWWAAAMDHIEDNDAHQWAERLDGDYKFEENAWLDSFRFGMRATDKHAITRESNYNWALLSHQYWGGGPPSFLTGSPGYSYQLQPFNDFMRGSVPYPGYGIFPSYQLVRNGTGYAYSILKPAETESYSWTPLTTDWNNYMPGGDNPAGGVNDQAEHTYAGYVLLRFKHDTFLGKMDGDVGVRVVRTVEAPASGALVIGPLGNALDPATCLKSFASSDCQTLANATAFVGDGGRQSLTYPGNAYTNVLPTLNLRFRLTSDLQMRLAAGQAMVRPSFTELVPFTTVGYKFLANTPYLDPANPNIATAGNPELKPIRANQADASIEWYFAPTGSLTFDAFYKDIHDYIFTGVDNVLVTNPATGRQAGFKELRYMNGSRGEIRGFELAYQQFYDLLPGILKGFGLQGNLTFVDSTGGTNSAVNVFDVNQVNGAADKTLPLEGLSRWSYNAAAIYERYRVSARVAWNWRERYLLTTSAANLNQPVWSENYGQLDGELFVNMTSNIKVGVQGTNLLNSRTFLDVGGAAFAPRYSWTDTDRRYALAVRAQF